MWRFILVTFAFLGFAFWELSGGADYAPSENSIQARANDPAPEVTVAESQPVEPPAPERIELPETTKPERFQITLASIGEMAEAGAAQQTARTERVEDKARFLTRPKTNEDNAVLAALEEGGAAADQVKRHWPGAIELFEQQASQAELREQAEAAARSARADMAYSDIRYITASSANMRGGPGTDFARVGSLGEGAEVAVLGRADNGWLELEVVTTGETGWMADWLVSDPAR
ncbi:Bacterial SH3 domain protein [Roseovarius sp. THAF8]|uniref:SH3 domain-containing protein n=1 Tax=Roseovarius sp. THAF8 TaxID=2587846 RepID=UPI0012685D2C|nr:SH3 domain-containing protein [Roseovarius sp. THAF8]QFT98710.1 Bacterial SH3 domain protein [Roseovarius sp. THAF8]